MAWNKQEWNAPAGEKPEKTGFGKRLGARVAGAVAGGIVVIGAIVAWLVLSSAPAPTETVTAAPAKPARAKPAAKPATAAPARPAQPAAAGQQVSKPAALPKDAVVSTTVTTNKSGSIIERFVMADGTTRSHIHPPAPVFKRTSDQVIALCLSAKPGQSMPPLPALDKSLERDFVESLSEPVEISENDSPEVRELKAQVMETRAYLKDEIKSGRTTLLEALREHQRNMESAADAHTMALQELRKMRQNGVTQEEAAEFVKAVNESFKARGIPELPAAKNGENRRGK